MDIKEIICAKHLTQGCQKVGGKYAVSYHYYLLAMLEFYVIALISASATFLCCSKDIYRAPGMGKGGKQNCIFYCEAGIIAFKVSQSHRAMVQQDLDVSLNSSMPPLAGCGRCAALWQ